MGTPTSCLCLTSRSRMWTRRPVVGAPTWRLQRGRDGRPRGVPAVDRPVVRAQPGSPCSSAIRATSRCPATTTATARRIVAVYRPSTGLWYVRNQFTVQFGDPRRHPGARRLQRRRHDRYRGVPAARPAMVRAEPVRRHQFGGAGDSRARRLQRRRDDRRRGVPAVARARGSCATSSPCSSASPGTCPVPGDYNGDGRRTSRSIGRRPGVVRAQPVRRAVRRCRGDIARAAATTTATARPTSRSIGRRPACGSCGTSSPCSSAIRRTPGAARTVARVALGGDYDGDGDGCRGVPAVDRPVVRAQPVRGAVRRPGRHAGAGRLQRRRRSIDVAVFRPSTGSGSCGTSSPCSSATRRLPVPGDYNGDGSPTSRSIGRRPACGSCATSSRCSSATPGDIPVPGDYNGDGVTDLAVYRPSTGQWFVRNQSRGAVRRRRATCRCRATTTATA